MGFNAVFNNLSVISRRQVPHNILCKQLAAFQHRLLAHWGKTNDDCHSDFCQNLEIMLAELGFELISSGLTARVATD